MGCNFYFKQYFIVFFLFILALNSCKDNVDDESIKCLKEQIVYLEKLINYNLKSIDEDYTDSHKTVFKNANLINDSVIDFTKYINILKSNNFDDDLYLSKLSTLYTKIKNINLQIERSKKFLLGEHVDLNLSLFNDSIQFLNNFIDKNDVLTNNKFTILELKLKNNQLSLFNKLSIQFDPDDKITVHKIDVMVDIENNLTSVGDTLKGNIYFVLLNKTSKLKVHFGKPDFELFNKNKGGINYKKNTNYDIPILNSERIISDVGKVPFGIPVKNKGVITIEGLLEMESNKYVSFYPFSKKYIVK